MQKYVVLFLVAISVGYASGQSLAGLNFRHIYDPQNEVSLSLKLVNEKQQLTVYYRLQPVGLPIDNYSIEWFRYDSYAQKDGTPLTDANSASTLPNGKISFPTPEKAWFLIARVVNKSSNTSWKYLQVIDARYPVNGWLSEAGTQDMVYKSYVSTGTKYLIHAADASKAIHIFYYKTDFPAAFPPFIESGSNTDRFMFPDSSFRASNGDTLTLGSKGLYLCQQDTAAAEGFAFMVVGPSFPKNSKIDEIPGPLIYISAKEEYDELLAAGNDKPKVDKVILDITRDRDRAKNFMRSYFRNVEFSRFFFTAYKEGWKTDKGMIFLIFGLPDEVIKNGLTETWYYKINKERFTFAKSGSIYDPNNYILQRSKRYNDLWFHTVDNWRKSRF